MTPEQIYGVWAPDASPWSPWVSPVIFPQLIVTESTSRLDIGGWPSEYMPDDPDGRAIVILDLPGERAVKVALLLAQRGYRPIPVFQGVPGPMASGADIGDFTMDANPARLEMSQGFRFAVVDMSDLVTAMQGATVLLSESSLSPDAPPVFMLDAFRLEGHRPPRPKLFDNRSLIFPQDFPSAQFLRTRGVERVILVQQGRLEPRDDLKHVLRRWQEAGIEIRAADLGQPGEARKIDVPRPSRFKTLWYRALAVMGLRRNSAGGFGSYIPEPSSSSGGFG